MAILLHKNTKNLCSKSDGVLLSWVLESNREIAQQIVPFRGGAVLFPYDRAFHRGQLL